VSVLVTDTGFSPAEPLPQGALELGPDTAPETLSEQVAGVDAIRIDFPTFADGRGFTLARRLRALGYAGRLRAHGHVLADQYAMARRSGFDEVEISDDLAARQPQEQWLARADWRANDYQARLRG